MISRQHIQTAAKMYEMQDTARSIFGTSYLEKIQPWLQLLESAEKKHACGTIEAALALSRAAMLSDFDVLLLTAAAVERIESGSSLADLSPLENHSSATLRDKKSKGDPGC